MPSFTWGGIAVLGLGAAFAFAGPAAASSSPVVGHVYVDDNAIGTNTISGFDRHANGTLTAIPGSPFVAGGAGTGASLASQGAIQITGDGRYVIAVDAGSDQLSVLRIKHDGRLKLVRDGVVSSGGADPVSVAEHYGLVYVANAGSGDSNYTGFILSRAGGLSPLANSTFTLPASAQPGDVLFNSSGSSLVGTRVGTSTIDSFAVGRDGRLEPAPGSPFPAQGPGPFGSEFRPTNPSQLFVSNAHGATGNGTISAFSVTRDGTLSSIGASPFADLQTAPCWVEISYDGRFLFTVNTGSGSISRYSIARDGTLTLLGSTALPGRNLAAQDVRVSSDDRELFVNETAVGKLAEFAVTGGDLTALGNISLPTGAGAAGLAVN